MQPPSTNPGNTKSTNASPDLGMACPPKRYIGPICFSKSAKIKAPLKAKIEAARAWLIMAGAASLVPPPRIAPAGSAKTDQNQDCEDAWI
jgi:hypothetical protein